jgi:proteic killer suppression protein
MPCVGERRKALRFSALRVLALNNATNPAGMNLPGLRLHPLRGERRGQWAVSVSGNWRVVFEFDGPDATDVDLVDYHWPHARR